jgi:hypothetical protein
MATCSTMTACETRCKAQIVAHSARNKSGQIMARFSALHEPVRDGQWRLGRDTE